MKVRTAWPLTVLLALFAPAMAQTEPVHPDPSGASSIVGSHTLIPDALFHAFSTFGALMSPELPLQRRQHEMIATMVSVTNRCVY